MRPKDVRIFRELENPHRFGFLKIRFFENHMIRIKQNQLRRRRQRVREKVLFLIDGLFKPPRFSPDVKIELHRQRIERRFLVHGLRLQHANKRLLGLSVPPGAHLKLRMPALKHPLVEERPHIFSGRFLDRVDQIDGLNALRAMAREIQVHRPPPGLFAEEIPDHVQDAGAFFVKMTVKQVVRVFIKLRRQRPAIALLVLVKIGLGIAAQLVHEFVMAHVVLFKERFEIGGESSRSATRATNPCR